jgi:hypothetical protein
MPFQSPTLGACVEVGNYISFSRASPSQASYQAHPSQASSRAQARPSEFGEKLGYFYYDFYYDSSSYYDPPFDDTRLVFISLYHPCMHYELGCVKNNFKILLIRLVKIGAFRFFGK